MTAREQWESIGRELEQLDPRQFEVMVERATRLIRDRMRSRVRAVAMRAIGDAT